MPNSYCSCRDFLVNTVNRKNGFIQFLNVKYGKILLSRRRQKQCFMILNLDFIYKLENPIWPTFKKATYDIETYSMFLLVACTVFNFILKAVFKITVFNKNLVHFGAASWPAGGSYAAKLWQFSRYDKKNCLFYSPRATGSTLAE